MRRGGVEREERERPQRGEGKRRENWRERERKGERERGAGQYKWQLRYNATILRQSTLLIMAHRNVM